ncbi:signal recognition particle-docking protein FtsY [Notoacmeibacter sp. MSK16QG-6]|uniref:signal recognition particle-docking protein FtsY n=1 Tax=Notoacmeibacter sp. MSK16QG-6 TaxID=2957982 RepID=UPI0020A0EFAB|nr:signal recognition particle-docking protein FtsY [Notoacmeibacter sp. MSK16QG-6]MCP1199176.1 signal recognition particle-docking protein FtsY [Notoacmeibacter sp. MSK16QG-6]
MARGFLGKVFSFGRKDEESDEADALDQPGAVPEERSFAQADGFAPDGTFQPSAETADIDGVAPAGPTEAGIAAEASPEPFIEPPSDEVAEERDSGDFAGGEEELTAPDSLAEPAAPPQPASQNRVRVGKSVERLGDASASPSRSSWLGRLTGGLARSSRAMGENLSVAFAGRQFTEDALDDIEDALVSADLGVPTATAILEKLRDARFGGDLSMDDVKKVVAREVEQTLAPVATPLELDLGHAPHVILVVGVNGTGKTTTIGKLAAKLTAGGLKVTLAAGDTFRAAAIEQLKIWADRTGSEVVATELGADAAALAYRGFERARENGSDVLIIDTAGRLQNKAELMDELAKIVRVLKKIDETAPHTVLQTLDATTGQNAMRQVEMFQQVSGVNGLVMTKLDGTARGGILVAIAEKFRLPVFFIGVGESVEDLEPFEARDFARVIAGMSPDRV